MDVGVHILLIDNELFGFFFPYSHKDIIEYIYSKD